MTKGDLVKDYWGDPGCPAQWMSVDEIAEKYDLTTADVRKAMLIYGVPVRSMAERTHREIWKMLVDDYNYEPGVDFIYKSTMNNKAVDFLIQVEKTGPFRGEKIGICIDDNIPAHQIDTIHIGNSMIVILSAGRRALIESIKVELMDARILPKHEVEEGGDNNGW